MTRSRKRQDNQDSELCHRCRFSVRAEHYYSHSPLNSLFMESGVPGIVPEGNCETKCSSWLRRRNADSSVDLMQVLGQIIQKFTDLEPDDCNQKIGLGQEHIRASFAQNQLTHHMNGFITLAGVNSAAMSLADFSKLATFRLSKQSSNVPSRNLIAIRTQRSRQPVPSLKRCARRTSA